jgi:hypothetical protein
MGRCFSFPRVGHQRPKKVGQTTVQINNQGPIPGNPMNIYLSKPMLRFVAESTDGPGRWSVRVTLKDNLRGVSLPLEASFNLLRK